MVFRLSDAQMGRGGLHCEVSPTNPAEHPPPVGNTVYDHLRRI